MSARLTDECLEKKMKVSELLQKRTTFSFEFYPARTPQASEELFETIRDLVPLEPSYVSVTYGAGGSTRELTHELVVRIHRETSLTVVPHLTCVNSTRSEIHRILERYQENGIKNVMALRGDPPKDGLKHVPQGEGFEHATDLVRFIQKNFSDFCIGVAGYPEGHPETPNRVKELEYLKAKVDAGAEYICTQLFFKNPEFYDFCERCDLMGIKVPVVAGIMPITSSRTMQRMSELALGMSYPARLMRAISRTDDDEKLARVGIHWATEQVRDLLDHNVRGVHFYTLNRSRHTIRIYDSLGVSKSSDLAM